jgi:putative ATP-binding cassette transporter
VRENVEGIALYQGEHQETTNLLHRFMGVIGNFRAIMHRTMLLNMVTVSYSQIAVIIPLVAAAPRYFAGKVPMGVLFQSASAFNSVQGALSWIVDRYDTLASWRAVVERLATFHQAIETARLVDANLIRTQSDDGGLHLHDLDLTLPNGTKLLEHADLTLAHGHSIVVSGRSGVGKSTLFRALSGIWPFARGKIEVPENMFFLPQKPNIPRGTLRYVITYPNDPEHYDRATLSQTLRDAGLPHLVDRLDRDDNWPQSLSGGELQRVAIARAMLSKPSWIFMDEATASLDPESEIEIYRALRTHLPDVTLVSIAHRTSVAELHDGQLTIQREGTSPGTLIGGTAS